MQISISITYLEPTILHLEIRRYSENGRYQKFLKYRICRCTYEPHVDRCGAIVDRETWRNKTFLRKSSRTKSYKYLNKINIVIDI